MSFKLISKFEPAGDQPKAIEFLIKGLKNQEKDQVLLGITGSGKTFTMANVIQKTGRPALIMAHNKTLAAQLYSEMKEFFPENAVEYFVSYYDYYQPEAYVARTDTFIEKDSSINEQIDLMRHSATRSMLERRDVIVVASISCIYGIGSPELYYSMVINLEVGMKMPLSVLLQDLVKLQYVRNDINFARGSFRVRGDVVDVFPAHHETRAWRIIFFDDEIEEIFEIDSLTNEKVAPLQKAVIYANSHYVTPRNTVNEAIEEIKKELKIRIEEFDRAGKLLESQRISERVKYDLEMLVETGSCKGIENYSRYLSGKKAGEAPPTLFEYLPKDALLFIDESHVTVPQIGAMYAGDKSRKTTLVEYGFRLPSALDNRPLKFEEWEAIRPQTIYVSATPGNVEIEKTAGEVISQIIRPTGLLDPICIIRPVDSQVDDLMMEARKRAAKDERVLVTTLTKKMAEHLTEYLHENGLKVTYIHSEVKTLERIEIINDLRSGKIDVLVGVNLLREGLDIPECSLVAILDADKEGFLRSETSLVQTIGRAARHLNGEVILYADKVTNSMHKAITETERRRKLQIEYNEKNGINPESIIKKISGSFAHLKEKEAEKMILKEKDLPKLKKQMLQHAANLEFEKAAALRDQILAIEKAILNS